MRASRLQSSVYVTFWLLGIGEMTRTYFRNPYDPTLQGTAAYGHTSSGELNLTLTIVAAEIVLFGAIVRPWSYRRSWARGALGAESCTRQRHD